MIPLQSYGFTTVESTLSDGGNFTTIATTTAPQVPSSGVCEPGGVSVISGSFWSGAVVQPGDSWPADQYSEVTLLSMSSPVGDQDIICVCRCASAAYTFYQIDIQGILGTSGDGRITVYYTIAGSSVQIGSLVTGLTFNIGDVVRLTTTGTTISVTQNGNSLFSQTDNHISSGSPGILFYDTIAITDTQISKWSAGGNQASTPTFSLGGTTLTITSSTSGGTIYYTNDGSAPTHSSSSISNGGNITVSPGQIIKAFESASNYADSSTGTYNVPSSGGSGNSPLGFVIFDLDSGGFPIAEIQTGTDS